MKSLNKTYVRESLNDNPHIGSRLIYTCFLLVGVFAAVLVYTEWKEQQSAAAHKQALYEALHSGR